MLMTPALLTQYGNMPGSPKNPACDAMLTIRPSPRSFITGYTARNNNRNACA
jgi:hypothetical protein